jgi:hypothetical protein
LNVDSENKEISFDQIISYTMKDFKTSKNKTQNIIKSVTSDIYIQ